MSLRLASCWDNPSSFQSSTVGAQFQLHPLSQVSTSRAGLVVIHMPHGLAGLVEALLFTGLWGFRAETKDRLSEPRGADPSHLVSSASCSVARVSSVREREPVKRRTAAWAQISALSIHPYALPSSGAFQLHHFADHADLPGRSENNCRQTAQPAATLAPHSPSPTLWVLYPFPSPTSLPTLWSHQK